MCTLMFFPHPTGAREPHTSHSSSLLSSPFSFTNMSAHRTPFGNASSNTGRSSSNRNSFIRDAAAGGGSSASGRRFTTPEGVRPSSSKRSKDSNGKKQPRASPNNVAKENYNPVNQAKVSFNAALSLAICVAKSTLHVVIRM